MAFGPHGPRAPTSAPGEGLKIFLSTLGLLGVAGAVFITVHSMGMSYLKNINFSFFTDNPFFFFSFFVRVGAPPPKTLTKEWQEASNERAKELNLNPISGT